MDYILLTVCLGLMALPTRAQGCRRDVKDFGELLYPRKRHVNCVIFPAKDGDMGFDANRRRKLPQAPLFFMT
jgi:hypothetical protein